LVTAELLTLIVLIEFLKKSERKWLFFILLLVYLAAFIINIIAPGNSVRAEAVIGTSPIMAIAKSLFYALLKIGEWTNLPQLAYIVAVAILSVFLVPECSMKFERPILALGMAFALFASQLTPPLYAMSSIGSGRQINIYYYSYYLLITFFVFYLCGWIYRSLQEQNTKDNNSKTLGMGKFVYKHVLMISIVLCIIWGTGCLDFPLVNMASAQILSSIIDGTLVQYDQEYKSIVDTLKSQSGDIELEDIQTVPPFLSNLGLSKDAGYWTNKAVARYFEVGSIKIPSK